MLSSIKKVNKYLIERFPLLWNTKLLWVLASALIFHLLFFIGGYFSLLDITRFHQYSVYASYFDGPVFLGIIISILQIVIWLIFLLKNNAFKEFYPTKKHTLFGHFFIYFIIFLCSISYYYSYTFGLKLYVQQKFPKEKVIEQIAQTNEAAVFFLHSINDYTVDKKLQPPLLQDLFCLKNKIEIDTSKSYLTFKDEWYQFYSLKSKDIPAESIYHTRVNSPTYVYSINKDSIYTVYEKDTVVDVSSIIKNAVPSYRNFTDVFFTLKDTISNSEVQNDFDFYSDDIIYDYNYENEFVPYRANKSRSITNKRVNELLDRNNPEEIKAILSNAYELFEAYKIPHNITPESWYSLLNLKGDFEVKKLIKNEVPNSYDYIAAMDIDSEFKKYSSTLYTDFYIQSRDLDRTFDNLIEIHEEPILAEEIHFFLWIAFGFAALVFAFRVTNLKSILFAIISGGILSVLMVLFAIFFSRSGNNEFLFQTIFIVIASAIVLPTLFAIKKLNKTVAGVMIVHSIVFFTLYIFIILSFISDIQRNICYDTYSSFEIEKQEPCTTILNTLDIHTSWVLLLVGFVFIYFYSNIIKKWSAQPEG